MLKRGAFTAFLLGTTALTSPAHAAPVLGFISGVVSAVAGTAPLVLTATTPFATGAAFVQGLAAFGIGGVLGNLALAVGASALASLLAPRPDFNVPQTVSPSERIVNLRQPTQFRSKAYGLVRTGGPVYFWQGRDGKRFYGIALNSGEIDGFESRYLDDRSVTVASNLVTNSEYQADGASAVGIYEYTGGSGQTAPAPLLNAFTEWTASHSLPGVAHAVVVAKNVPTADFSTVYPSGREPVYSGLIRGTKCYNPRSQTTVYTKNAALILADWITSAEGLGRTVDWDEVADEADHADTIVTDRDSNSIAKWELCGSFLFQETRESVRANMAVACDAFFYERTDGKVGFKLGRYDAPTITITGDHIRELNLTEGVDGVSVKNGQTVAFTDPANDYREQESSAYVIDDGAAYQQGSVQAFWVPNHNQAVRVAKRLLLQERAQYRMAATLTLQGLRLLCDSQGRAHRFFQLTVTELGLDQVMEIDRLSLSDDGLSVEVEAHSVQSTDFDFDAATEESSQPQTKTIATTTTVADPTNVSAVSSNGGVFVSWDDPPNATYMHDIRYRQSDTGGGSPGGWFELSVPQGQTFQFVPSLIDGESYDVQVRARSQGGRASDWTPSTPIAVTVVADNTAPDSVSGVSATGGSGTVDLDWTAPNSPNYAGTRIYRNTVDAFGSATLIETEYGAPDTADSFQDSGLAADDYYYWLVAINASGVQATEVATGAVTVT